MGRDWAHDSFLSALAPPAVNKPKRYSPKSKNKDTVKPFET